VDSVGNICNPPEAIKDYLYAVCCRTTIRTLVDMQMIILESFFSNFIIIIYIALGSAKYIQITQKTWFTNHTMMFTD
jgi:hypothetical protein